MSVVKSVEMITVERAEIIENSEYRGIPAHETIQQECSVLLVFSLVMFR